MRPPRSLTLETSCSGTEEEHKDPSSSEAAEASSDDDDGDGAEEEGRQQPRGGGSHEEDQGRCCSLGKAAQVRERKKSVKNQKSFSWCFHDRSIASLHAPARRVPRGASTAPLVPCSSPPCSPRNRRALQLNFRLAFPAEH